MRLSERTDSFTTLRPPEDELQAVAVAGWLRRRYDAGAKEREIFGTKEGGKMWNSLLFRAGLCNFQTRLIHNDEGNKIE